MRTEFTSQGGGRKKEKKKNNEKSDNRCTQEHTEIGLSSNPGVRPVRDNCSGARARNGAVMCSEIHLYNVHTSISTLLIVRTRVNNTTTSKYCNDINAGFSADKLITIEVVNRRQRGQERNTLKSCYPALSPYPHQVCTHTHGRTHTHTHEVGQRPTARSLNLHLFHRISLCPHLSNTYANNLKQETPNWRGQDAH